MKLGRSLTEIAAELERQRESRKDFIAPQGVVDAKVIDGEIVLDGINGKPLGIAPFAHKQFADHLDIPTRYYDRMLEKQPELLAQNLNGWLHAAGNERRMIRTLDGRVRAFLSPKFRPLDNFDLANVVIPALMERDAQVVSSELTETRMYIKAILPSLSDELPEGLVWGAGHHIFGATDRRIVSAVVISNSDVGAGTLRVEPSVYAAYCTNLAALVEAAMRKYHVGRSHDATDNYEVYRDETRQADDKAFWLKVRDVTASAFAEDKFRKAIDQIRHASEQPIVSDDLPKVVEVAVKRLSLPESTQGSVLSWLAKGGLLSQYGLSSAVTRTAQDVESYEVATQLERIGGEILALGPADWKTIATAA